MSTDGPRVGQRLLEFPARRLPHSLPDMTRKICLALQGGGAHGAFTWGVLDRLLREESLDFEAVSGTSAGAMNGAILVDALKRGGRGHARERLERFWRGISDAGDRVFK